MDNTIIKDHFDRLEKLLMHADEAVASSRTPLMRKRATRQRNAINAACNALYRAYML